MATLIIGADDQPIPFPFTAPIIETKEKWDDEWKLDPDLTLVSCGAHAGSVISSCEVERRYGQGYFPQDVPSTTDPPPIRNPYSLNGQWVRFTIIGEQVANAPPAGGNAPKATPQIQFVGQFMGEANEFKGTDKAPSGHQHWVASGGLKILEKIDV